MKEITFLFCFFAGYYFNQTSAFEFFDLNGIDHLRNLFIRKDLYKKNAVKFEYDSKGLQLPKLKGFTSNTLLSCTLSYSNDQCLFYEFPEPIEKGKKHPVQVICTSTGGSNGTLKIISSVKDVIDVLNPYGNSTKKDKIGRCVVMLFYTTSCPGCVLIAPKINALARQFPNITIAAIDAIKHHTLNTEFGVFSLPTIMLFHQGRPVAKFNETSSTVTNFVKFVTKHTGIKPIFSVFVTSDDFNGPLSNKMVNETDFCLFLAWGFILLCSVYYFTKSKTFVYLTEIIKRNWIESAQRSQLEN